MSLIPPAYLAPSFRKASIRKPQIARIIRFRVHENTSAHLLGHFLGTLTCLGVYWERDEDESEKGVYKFLAPNGHPHDADKTEEMLKENYINIGCIVPFSPKPFVSGESRKPFCAPGPAPTGWCIVWTFGLHSIFDGEEVRELFKTITDRGGWFRHLKDEKYTILVPEHLDSVPFQLAIDDCPSTKNLDKTCFRMRMHSKEK